MDKRAVIISAFVLAALIVGLIWYQLIQGTNVEEEPRAEVTPTPIIVRQPSPSPVVEFVPGEKTKGGLVQGASDVVDVAPTAPTGPGKLFSRLIGWAL